MVFDAQDGGSGGLGGLGIWEGNGYSTQDTRNGMAWRLDALVFIGYSK